MKRPHLVLKIAVVANALLLGGGFVSYHAGAFHWLAKADTQPAASESSPAPEGKTPNIDWEYRFTPAGSESSPAPEAKPADGPLRPAPTIMSGPKSFEPMILLNGLTPADPSTPIPAVELPTDAANEPPPTSNKSKPAP